MIIGSYKVNTGAVVLIVLVLSGLLYWGLNRVGVVDRLLTKFRGEDSKSVTLTKRENFETVDVSKIPKSQVKPPQRTTDNPEVVIGIWTWMPAAGVIDAVGGTGYSGDHPDSPLAQAGITRTRILVQNDTAEQAKLLASGNLHIMTTTGDQSAIDITGANNLLGGNYAKAVFSGGYSHGEDCVMMPESIVKDPQLARGILLVAAVPYCDWNVAVNWAIDNKDADGKGIPINPDESSYDPNAINFVNAVDHIEAAQKYVQNAKVALRNVQTGKTEEHEINGLGTWLPGDVMAVRGRPTVTYKGKTEKLQKVISTKQYAYMMPNILVVDIRWANQHRDYLDTLFRVIARSNEKIQTDDQYFRDRVTPLVASVFNLERPDFWYRYFSGKTENGVPLGGSRVSNISEIRHLFGMDQGGLEQSVFARTYTDHGNRLHQLMPERLPSFLSVNEVVDTSFIAGMTGEQTSVTNFKADLSQTSNERVTIKGDFQINFDNNSAVVRPSEFAKLQELMSLLIRAGGTKIVIEGHTDVSGDINRNVALSQQRAASVWNWLKANDRSGIVTEDRLVGKPQGFGPYRLLEGREPTDPLHRRVTIILK